MFNLKVKYKLLKLERFSGNKASIYTIYIESERVTLFEKFIAENKDCITELMNIAGRLRSIGNEVGAREHFFKLFEGRSGDHVCALYDVPKKFLRLYCIRYNNSLIVIGGGGRKNVRTWQEDPKLTEEVSTMMEVSKAVDRKIANGDLWINDDFDFEGNLNFNADEE